MFSEDSEKLRAENIIWNAAQDYSFTSEVRAFDARGRADLYFNYIIGAVHRYWDYPRIKSFAEELERSIQRELLRGLLWLALESCAYERSRLERPVLTRLREGYARELLSDYNRRNEDAQALESAHHELLLRQVREEHYRRALGERRAKGLAAQLADELEFPAELSTEEIISRMEALIERHFSASDRRLGRGGRGKLPFSIKFRHNAYLDPGAGLEFDSEDRKNEQLMRLIKLPGRSPEERRRHVVECYGESTLTEEETAALEKDFCIGIHAGCRLHFTRGDFGEEKPKAASAKFRAGAIRQRQLNIRAYRADITRNTCAIAKLTNIIKNTLLVNLEPPPSHNDCGRLDGGAAWRYPALEDEHIFRRPIFETQEDISVDIMLDCSSSQQERQEEISTQAYIIAESFTRCRIPVRVLSFCSDEEYTIIRTFRDYEETGENERIFSYHASGCNRDGLATKAVVNMIRGTNYGTKVLIVLTDGLPNDTQGVRTGGAVRDYVGKIGVDDTALEVRRGMREGISVLCVFTGRDGQVPDAKRIYGRDLAYIRSQTRFAEVVGVLIRNELKK